MANEIVPFQPKSEVIDTLQELVARAHKGDESVLPQLRRTLEEHPEVWQHAGDLAEHAKNAWISLLAGENLVVKESLLRKIEALREELSGPKPSPLEKLLVERVIIGWLQVYHADLATAQNSGGAVKLLEFYQKRLVQVEKRYVAAIRNLALVRKLLPVEVEATVVRYLEPVENTTVNREHDREGMDRNSAKSKQAATEYGVVKPINGGLSLVSFPAKCKHNGHNNRLSPYLTEADAAGKY